jgi:endonuclease/exonuclease/phosphatase family metal-dependent hydrolase
MRAQSVKLMTYNMLNWLADGTQETGGIVPPWSERRVAAAALIKSVGPDVIAIQEGNQTTSTGYRQVDSLRDALASAGIDYTVAYVPPYARNHIMYRPDVYRPVGSGGQWQIGDGHTGAYQELENITSGARFLFVSAHTVPGNTRDLDLVREAETESLITQATAMAAAQNVPLVFGGDFNSSPVTSLHPIDGPAIAMRHHHMADARLVAQSHVNEQYQSFNGYIRTPHVYTIDIDYIWVSPGVSASSWGMAMRLSNGSFVGTIPSDHNPVYSQVQYPY